MARPHLPSTPFLVAILALALGACASSLDDAPPTLPAWELPDRGTPEARVELERGLAWIVQDAARTGAHGVDASPARAADEASAQVTHGRGPQWPVPQTALDEVGP